MVGSEFTDLIGIPFVDGGRDPARGLDCWGILMLTAKRFGYEVPDFNISCFDVPGIEEIYQHEAIAGRWRRREDPQPGDVVTMALAPLMPDVIQHFGIYLGAGKFLHTTKKTGSCISSIDQPIWKNRIKGYYEWIKER